MGFNSGFKGLMDGFRLTIGPEIFLFTIGSALISLSYRMDTFLRREKLLVISDTAQFLNAWRVLLRQRNNLIPTSSVRIISLPFRIYLVSKNLQSVVHRLLLTRTKNRPAAPSARVGLWRRSAAASLLRLWVRITPRTRMSVSCDCCVLSGRSICDELTTNPEESCRLLCVVV